MQTLKAIQRRSRRASFNRKPPKAETRTGGPARAQTSRSPGARKSPGETSEPISPGFLSDLDPSASTLTPLFLRGGFPSQPEPPREEMETGTRAESAEAEWEKGKREEEQEESGKEKEKSEKKPEEASGEPADETADKKEDAGGGGASAGAEEGAASGAWSESPGERVPAGGAESPRDDVLAGASTVSAGDSDGLDAFVPIIPEPLVLGVPTPFIPSPPRSAVEQSEEIRTTTGSDPSTHHARVRQTMTRVAEAARRAQRSVVHNVDVLSRDARVSIEELADEIPRAAAGAEAFIDTAIKDAQGSICRISAEQIKSIEKHGARVGQELEDSKDKALKSVHQQLIAESPDIKEADEEIQKQFQVDQKKAQKFVEAVPIKGTAEFLPVSKGEGTGEGKGDGKGEGKGGEGSGDAAPSKKFEDAVKDLVAELYSRGEKNKIAAYCAHLYKPVLKRKVEQQKTTMIKGAEHRAGKLGSDATKARFAYFALGLMAPFKKKKVSEAERIRKEAEEKTRKSSRKTTSAKDRAIANIRKKRKGVIRHMDVELRPLLKKGLR
ncbi:MAG: hypothetical protein GY859_43130, partial [Desulfobacterales bacterium]|nr:hypothetical protein [Desulfobacterales bacterium]